MNRRYILAIFLIVGLLSVMVIPAQAATITVINTNDSGAGSLRQAIISAAAGATTFSPAAVPLVPRDITWQTTQ